LNFVGRSRYDQQWHRQDIERCITVLGLIF
jgi:hypothetical protein